MVTMGVNTKCTWWPPNPLLPVQVGCEVLISLRSMERDTGRPQKGVTHLVSTQKPLYTCQVTEPPITPQPKPPPWHINHCPELTMHPPHACKLLVIGCIVSAWNPQCGLPPPGHLEHKEWLQHAPTTTDDAAPIPTSVSPCSWGGSWVPALDTGTNTPKQWETTPQAPALPTQGTGVNKQYTTCLQPHEQLLWGGTMLVPNGGQQQCTEDNNNAWGTMTMHEGW